MGSGDKPHPMSHTGTHPKLPGQPASPTTHAHNRHELHEKQLLQPVFGPFLSIEEFQDELDSDLRHTFGDDRGGMVSDALAPRPPPPANNKEYGFDPDILEEAEDLIARFAPDEAARAQVQNLQLAETEKTLEKLKDKAQQLDERNRKETEINKALKAEVKKLKTQNVDIEERVEDLRREGEATGLVKAANAAEEKKFRELETRMKREEAKRKALELGQELEEEDFVELPGDRFGISKSFQLYMKKARATVQLIDGMHKPCKRAESQFGSGIALYFWFYRWIIHGIARLALIWIVFYIFHIVDFAKKGKVVRWVGTIFPTFLLYSSFELPISYAIILTVTLGLTLASAVSKFIREFEIKHKTDVYNLDGEPERYAKIVLNAWDWNTSKVQEGKDLSARIASLLQVLKLEDQVNERIAARTQREWTILYIKRVAGISLNVIFLLAGLAGITISRLVLSGSLADQYSGFAALVIRNLPVVIPSAINGLLPQIVNFSVALEAWDDPSTQLKNSVGRLYAAKIMNALIQVVIVLIFFRGPLENFGNQRITLRDCGYATCEDQAGAAFFTLFLSDIIIGTFSTLGVAVGTKVVFTALQMPSWASAEFQPPVQLIKILYQQIFMWLSLPHFPIVVPVALLLWYVQFKVDAFVLFKYNKKPLRPFDARDSGVYFTMFYAITLFLFCMWMYYVYFLLTSSILDLSCCRLPELIQAGNSTVRECFAVQTVTRTDASGNSITVNNNADVCQTNALTIYGLQTQPTVPFDTLSMSQTLSAALSQSTDSSWFLEMVDSALFGYFAATVMFVLFLYEKMRVNVLESYLDDKINEMTETIVAMEAQVKIKQKRIELITSQGKDADEGWEQQG